MSLITSKRCMPLPMYVQDNIPLLVSSQDNDCLTKPSSLDEVRQIVFSMNGKGAPGSDGFGGSFYQHFWDIIQYDIFNFVSQFFLQSWLSPTFNSNLVVLNPKFSEAAAISDYPPIVLANFHFKIIADRLADLALCLISQELCTFVKGRSIFDSIGIYFESVNMLDRKICGGNIALKLDITKACYTIDWAFLIHILIAFSFNDKFCHWIKLILQLVKLSFLINDRHVGFFSCSQGVRRKEIHSLGYFSNWRKTFLPQPSLAWSPRVTYIP